MVENGVTKKFRCEKCPYETNHKGHFIAHVKVIHDKIKDHICEKCGRALSSKRSLQYHMKISYCTDTKEYRRPPKYVCRKCQKVFYRKYQLKRHEDGCNVNESCNVCGVRVKIGGLERHINLSLIHI